MYHPNNFKCKTYWNYTEDGVLEEPEQRTSQYEMSVKDEGFGKKLAINIFSRVGTDPLHKRDFYSYIEFPFDSTFAKSLYEFLKEDYSVNDSMKKDLTNPAICL